MKMSHRLLIPLSSLLLLAAGCEKPAAPAQEQQPAPATIGSEEMPVAEAPAEETVPAPTPAPTPAVKKPVAAPKPAPTPAPAPSVPALSGNVNASISNFEFGPKTMTVKKGTKVTWKNNDRVQHTVTGDKGAPFSPEMQVGDSYTYTFNTVGTFPYHCGFHPTMKGTVTVVE